MGSGIALSYTHGLKRGALTVDTMLNLCGKKVTNGKESGTRFSLKRTLQKDKKGGSGTTCFFRPREILVISSSALYGAGFLYRAKVLLEKICLFILRGNVFIRRGMRGASSLMREHLIFLRLAVKFTCHII